MKKMIHLRNGSQKRLAKKSSSVSAKHIRYPRKNMMKAVAPEESDAASSIRSKPAVLEKKSQDLLSLDLLLEAGRVLSLTKKADQNTSGVDLALPLFRAIAPVYGSDHPKRRKGICHVIPSDDNGPPNGKASESSASDHDKLNRALHKAIYILDSDSLGNDVRFEPKPSVVSSSRSRTSSGDDAPARANPIPKCCRPIPPPPRLPRVPIGFAFTSGNFRTKSLGTRPSISITPSSPTPEASTTRPSRSR